VAGGEGRQGTDLSSPAAGVLGGGAGRTCPRPKVDEQLLNCQAIYGVIGTIRACPSADFSKYDTSLWLAKNGIVASQNRAEGAPQCYPGRRQGDGRAA
jgi:hypothetical protein